MGFAGASPYRDRHGKVRWRYRAKGCNVPLRGLPGSPEFAESYAAAVEGRKPQLASPAELIKAGTMKALSRGYQASAEFKLLSAATQRTYLGILNRLEADHGHLPARGLRREHVLAMRDKRADTPAAANNMVKVLRALMTFAVDRGVRSDNPTDRVKALRYASEGNHVWTEAEIATFKDRWPLGTRERLAMELLLCTAQRSGDVRQMGRQHVSGGMIKVRQSKTGEPLDLPVHPDLAAALALAPKTELTLITTQHGKPYTAAGFGNWFAEACDRAGLPHCSAHGLRHSAATRLADVGCSEAQIMAWTGHRTSRQVQRYTRQRDQRALAEQALAKIVGTETEQDLANPAERFAKTGSK